MARLARCSLFSPTVRLIRSEPCHRTYLVILGSLVDIDVDGDAAILGEHRTIGGLKVVVVEAFDLDIVVDGVSRL